MSGKLLVRMEGEGITLWNQPQSPDQEDCGQGDDCFSCQGVRPISNRGFALGLRLIFHQIQGRTSLEPGNLLGIVRVFALDRFLGAIFMLKGHGE